MNSDNNCVDHRDIMCSKNVLLIAIVNLIFFIVDGIAAIVCYIHALCAERDLLGALYTSEKKLLS